MNRLISFVYDPLSGRYRFFGCLHQISDVVCGEILKHLLIVEATPHYFDIWVGGKEPQFILQKNVSAKFEPRNVYYAGENQTLYKKIETTTWTLNGAPVSLTTSLQEIVSKAIGENAGKLEFDVYTYGIRR